MLYDINTEVQDHINTYLHLLREKCFIDETEREMGLLDNYKFLRSYGDRGVEYHMCINLQKNSTDILDVVCEYVTSPTTFEKSLKLLKNENKFQYVTFRSGVCWDTKKLKCISTEEDLFQQSTSLNYHDLSVEVILQMDELFNVIQEYVREYD